jgi:hypothetical protein
MAKMLHFHNPSILLGRLCRFNLLLLIIEFYLRVGLSMHTRTDVRYMYEVHPIYARHSYDKSFNTYGSRYLFVWNNLPTRCWAASVRGMELLADCAGRCADSGAAHHCRATMSCSARNSIQVGDERVVAGLFEAC